MSKPKSNPAPESATPSAAVVAEWLTPFLDFLAKERRYSVYTVRNYRQAFEDFHAWLKASDRNASDFAALTPRDMRDFVIEGQRRFGRRTLHNHVSGLRAFFRFWMQHGKVPRNPFTGIPLPKLEKNLPKFLTETQVAALLNGPLKLFEAASAAYRRWELTNKPKKPQEPAPVIALEQFKKASPY